MTIDKIRENYVGDYPVDFHIVPDCEWQLESNSHKVILNFVGYEEDDGFEYTGVYILFCSNDQWYQTEEPIYIGQGIPLLLPVRLGQIKAKADKII